VLELFGKQFNSVLLLLLYVCCFFLFRFFVFHFLGFLSLCRVSVSGKVDIELPWSTDVLFTLFVLVLLGVSTIW
jgi:hypothetical protein